MPGTELRYEGVNRGTGAFIQGGLLQKVPGTKLHKGCICPGGSPEKGARYRTAEVSVWKLVVFTGIHKGALVEF